MAPWVGQRKTLVPTSETSPQRGGAASPKSLARRHASGVGTPLHPVLGHTKPDPAASIIGTGFIRFLTCSGVAGLARLTVPGILDILAVQSSRPGTGQFRAFICAAKLHFTHIRIFEVWSDRLKKCLPRYGFTRFDHPQADDCWEWMSYATSTQPTA